MDALVTDKLLNILMISITLSVFVMALVQKFKELRCINQSWQIWLINLCLSLLIGIPFGSWFYKLKLIDNLWLSLFCFIGASTLYKALKAQNILRYNPRSLDTTSNSKDAIIVPKENMIKR